ncbi:MAG: 4Fe-4S dicluster domain-containing protein [Elusimicrobiota bacterium]
MISTTRRRIQLLFLLFSITASFGLITHRGVIAGYNSMHVFPSLSALFWLALPPAIWMTALFLLLPLIAGRLYCSYLCPVGLLQDLAARLGDKLGIKARPVAGFHELRILVLVMSVGFMALWSSTYLYFDHFSNLGRVYGVLDALASGGPFGTSFALGLLFLGTILIVPIFFPRWFCAALCPSGTLFMLLQRWSLFKVRINEDCAECGLCHDACPVRCIHDEGIDMDQCIACLECLRVCPSEAIGYNAGAGRIGRLFAERKPDRPAGAAASRKSFLKTATAAALGAAGAYFVKVRILEAAPSRPNTVVPPGGSSWDQFLQRCVGCHACVNVCPTDVLMPADFENSALGLGKIRMDYDAGYCSYECNACLSVCPSRALSYYPLPVKQRIKMGSSKIDEELCIPYAKGKDCAACHEQCPTGAITMKKHKGVFAPVVNDDYCIGCGACDYACPVTPDKAVRVTPREVHTFAFNPKQHGPKAKIGEQFLREAQDEGFPF